MGAFKKKTCLILSASLLTGTVFTGTAIPESVDDYTMVPPFLTNQEPPLVMLVMGRNHKMYYEAYNDASDLNEDGGLDVGYKGLAEEYTDSNSNGKWDAAEPYVDQDGSNSWNAGEPYTDVNGNGSYDDAEPLTDRNGDDQWNDAIDYYGYFDSYKCYEYDSSDDTFKPSSAPKSGTTPIKKCSGADEWSGDFLNYATMTRMDTMRKVLYGGYRSTDTGSETVLERVFIPQDAHSFGKEYESVARDGYDIRDFTPLDLPVAGTRHLLASTTLDQDGDNDGSDDPPLLRVLPNSKHRIWNWVAKESPVADNSLEDSSSTGSIFTGSIDDHTEYESIILEFANAAHHQGSDQVTRVDDGGTNINPYMTDPDNRYLTVYNATLKISNRSGYRNVFDFGIDGDDAVEIVIQDPYNGTEHVYGWYGPHGPANNYNHNTGPINLAPGEYPIEFRHHEEGGGEVRRLRYRRQENDNSWGNWWHVDHDNDSSRNMLTTTHWTRSFYNLVRNAGAASVITDYEVRVEVCDATFPESNCKKYPDGNYKPIGLLQRYGESDQMMFGLLSGSYEKNTQGGVLRKNVGTIRDEIDSDDGTFLTPTGGGIIDTINKFRVTDYNYGSDVYNGCGWLNRPMRDDGECTSWGNPTAEMMYEGMRYFAGKASPTSEYDYTVSGSIDDSIGLPKPAWIDPYLIEDADRDGVFDSGEDTNGNGTFDNNFENCAKPFMLVLSDIYPTYDSNSLPGSHFGTFTGDLSSPAMNVATLAETITDGESEFSGDFFIGRSGTDEDGACSVKTIDELGEARGLCPEEPTKQGSYYAASVAYYGNKYDISASAEGNQNVTTYAVGLASPLPQIDIDVDGHTITIVPFGKSVGGSHGMNSTHPSAGGYQPSDTIVDFFVEKITPTHGIFRVNFEDVEQGADHDMDAIIRYEYTVNADNSVDITLDSTYASGSIIQHLGYIISGTTKDGVYLEVRDEDTGASSDPDYFLDTPASCVGPNDPVNCWDDNSELPKLTTRKFYPGTVPAASLLDDPLRYAAKWGGFTDSNTATEDTNGNGILDAGEDLNSNNAIDYLVDPKPDQNEEWDEDGDGTPDSYFYVVNPLRLEEQLNKSFAAILRRTSSGTAASVISNSRSGEGAVYQSIFYPQQKFGSAAVNWIGEVHGLFVDSYGNMREDTNGNAKLDIETEDLNGDGVLQTDLSEDLDGDNILDVGEDLNGNNYLDLHLNEDADKDGKLTTRDLIIVFNGTTVYKYDDVNQNEQIDVEDQIRFDPDYADWHGNGVLNTEDTNGDGSLDPSEDTNGNGILDTEDTNDNGVLDTELLPGTYSIDDIHYLWSAKDWLNTSDVMNQRAYNTDDNKRYIFTFVDKDGDMIVDAGEQVPFENTTVPVTSTQLADTDTLYPYLTLYPNFTDKPAWVSDIDTNGNGAAFREIQAQRLVEFIRGKDQAAVTVGGSGTPVDTIPEMRNRTYIDPDDSLTKTWRLGDIVHSSPVAVGRPQESYHLLYRDPTYAKFLARHQLRRSVVYVGANDGMVHAFNAGFYDDDTKSFKEALAEPFTDSNGDGNYDDGKETYTDSNLDGHYNGPTGESYFDVDNDGHYDDTEPYTDSNSNGQWDDGEPYTDTDGDGMYDPGEPYTDVDGDCRYDSTEPFSDLDGDGVWDEVAEPYDDLNGNGIYDTPEYYDADKDGHQDCVDEGFTDNDGDGTYTIGVDDFDTANPLHDLDGDGKWDASENCTDTNGNGTIDEGEPFTDTDGSFFWSAAEPYTDTDGDGHRDLDEPYTDSDGNGLYTAGESYTDLNGDCAYLSPEPFSDQDVDSTYDAGEPYLDLNGNGRFDGSEWYYDTDGSGSWDPGEPLSDLDGDGVYDEDEPFNDDDGDGHLDEVAESFVDLNNNGVWDSASQTTYDLGSELWAYVPFNQLPHLYWLTEPEYPHVYYNDLQPKVFDAKIFTPEPECAAQPASTACIHPEGWGTVMVIGMRLGGGEIVADIDHDDVVDVEDPTDSTVPYDPIMSSAYVVFDITDPESPPRVMAEIQLEGQGYTTCYPAVIPMRSKSGTGSTATFNSNDWYLVFGSGPADSNGNAAGHDDATILTLGHSEQKGKMYIVDLQSLNDSANPIVKTIGTDGKLTADSPFFIEEFEDNSFISQPVSIDYDLDFNAETLYFGTINGSEVSSWGGMLRRIIIEDEVMGETTPDKVNWVDTNAGGIDRANNYLIDLTNVESGQPISAAVAVTIGDVARASDGSIIDINGDGAADLNDRERWVYFGTGRFMIRGDADNEDQQSYYGIKEPWFQNSDDRLYGKPVTRTTLLDVGAVNVYDDKRVTGTISSVTDWDDLIGAIDARDGWYFNFPDRKERNLGQAVLLGEVLTFTSYVPALDVCAFEGESYLWALYYKTGTGYPDAIIGYEHEDDGDDIVESGEKRSNRRLSLGSGLALTPNVHTGSEDGSKAFVQTSTGAIETIDQKNPGMTKSGKTSWLER